MTDYDRLIDWLLKIFFFRLKITSLSTNRIRIWSQKIPISGETTSQLNGRVIDRAIQIQAECILRMLDSMSWKNDSIEKASVALLSLHHMQWEHSGEIFEITDCHKQGKWWSILRKKDSKDDDCHTESIENILSNEWFWMFVNRIDRHHFIRDKQCMINQFPPWVSLPHKPVM